MFWMASDRLQLLMQLDEQRTAVSMEYVIAA